MATRLKLNLDQLQVDSFDTAVGRPVRGTVFAEQCTCYTNCTCPGCPTCDHTACWQDTCQTCQGQQTCWETCNRADRTCDVTCDPWACQTQTYCGICI